MDGFYGRMLYYLYKVYTKNPPNIHVYNRILENTAAFRNLRK